MAYQNFGYERAARLVPTVAVCLLGTYLFSSFVAPDDSVSADQVMRIARDPNTDPGLAGCRVCRGTVTC